MEIKQSKKITEYNTKTIYESNYIKLSDIMDISNFNGDDTYILSFVEEKNITGSYIKQHKKKRDEIVNETTLKTILDYPHLFENHISERKIDNNFFFIDKNYKEIFKKYGNHQYIYNLYKEKHKTINEFIPKEIMQNLNNNSFEFLQLLENEHDLKIFVDKNGNKYCEPIFIDYIIGKLDNQTYNLDKLVEHLGNRTDIDFVIDSEYRPRIINSPLKNNEKDLKKIIENIPSYNSTEEKTERITIVYKPNSEDLEKILQVKKSKELYSIEKYILDEILNCKDFNKKIDGNMPRKFKV